MMKSQVMRMFLIGVAGLVGTAQQTKGQCTCEGDVNGDGVVNIIDILDVYECATGLVPASDPKCDIADVNCDGTTDTCDMSRVYCVFVGGTNCCEQIPVCGACCNDGSNFRSCEVVSRETCTSLLFSGTYLGDGTTCDPVPCECLSDADCDDGSVCTTDTCGPLNNCVHEPVPDGTACDDGKVCNGFERCEAGRCIEGTPVNCDDGIACTSDECTEPGGVCISGINLCNHDGVCDVECESIGTCPDDCACAATRDLSDGALAYCPSDIKTVRIALSVQPETFAIGVEDSLPAGWTQVLNISDGGLFDAANNKVKWGPLFGPFPAELTYDVLVPDTATGVNCFTGTVSVDGVNQPICGQECVEESCCSYLRADEPAAVCAGCGDCTCAACRDGRMELCEMIGYACAWQRGCNDDLAGMTRAAFIWVTGECYCWDEVAQTWFPSPCAGSNSVCCTGGSAAGLRELSSPVGAAILSYDRAKRSTPRGRAGRGVTKPVTVSIDVLAPAGTAVMALECSVPRGWKIEAISDGGTWDGSSRKVKWGPFFENPTRSVTVRVRAKGAATDLNALDGSVSFDGINFPILRE